jgi:sugar fermentation stimulation protein A
MGPPVDSVVPARFVERPNRFLVVADLDDGQQVAAYLPNTGRLQHLLSPGRRLILRPEAAPGRRTAYTVTRAWDGCWVGLEAGRAPGLLAAWLLEGEKLSPFGEVLELAAEVRVEGHRLDFRLTTVSGPVWVEVKSGGRALDGTALLSKTPSTRGVAHLRILAGLVEAGQAAAVAFVIQREDARRFRVGGDADPGWIDAVGAAHQAGVEVVAFGCEVSEQRVEIARRLPMLWG